MSDALPTRQAEVAPPLKGGVVPYLMLDGAAAAIDFYKRALGAEEVGGRTSMEDGRICNARIDVNGGSIMLMDPMPEQGYPAPLTTASTFTCMWTTPTAGSTGRWRPAAAW